MSYLYGDSTPSPLEVNFLDVLRHVLDFCVEVLQVTERVEKNADRGVSLKRVAQAEVERLETLGGAVPRAVAGVPTGDAEGATARCATAIVKSAGELVRAETAGVQQALNAELARLEAVSVREREGCVRALEAFLLRHDLPETALVLNLQVQPGGRYAARLRVTTPFGLVAMLDLEVPPDHLLSHVVRIDRVMDRLEVQAPEAAGRPHKEVKLRPQRLEKLHVAELTIGAAEKVMRLRATPEGTGAGFDVLVRAEAPRARLARVGESQQAVESPLEMSDADAAKLLELYRKLEVPAIELTHRRKALTQVSLDDRPLREHENPAVLVGRLVGAMAPVVQEIAWRSRSATELILKRLLADDRREEIFVSKSELCKKLDPLPRALRKVFDPLGLAAENELAAPFPSARRPSTQPGPKTAVPPPHYPPRSGDEKTPAGGERVIDVDEPPPRELSGKVPPMRRH